MRRRNRLNKQVDDESRFQCAGGVGILREEVWVNDAEEVVYYNLAFIVPHLSHVDQGRILGFDNAHGKHERHLLGRVEEVAFVDYAATSESFHFEVQELRRRYEDKDFY